MIDGKNRCEVGEVDRDSGRQEGHGENKKQLY